MKKLLAMFLALTMTMSLAACGGTASVQSTETPAANVEEAATPAATPTKADDGKLVVGFAQIGQESGWRDAETNDIQWYAARNTDTLQLEFADAQQKQENQIKAIRNFIEMGVDVIAFPPVVETGWEAVLTECKEAGIPVILVDRGVDASCEDLYDCKIASDFIWEGEQAAKVMGDLLGGKGKIVELEGTVGASAATDRKTGFDDYMAANYPDVEILASQTGDFTRTLGKEVMESFLKTYGAEINGVYCHNDDMALGAIEAIKEAGFKPGEDIKIIGVDGVKGAFEAMVAGEMNCTVECNPCLANQIFETAAKLKAGESVEKWVVSIDGVYTSDQAADVIDSRTY
jgi:simple sugar transport system substrate-binding protein